MTITAVARHNTTRVFENASKPSITTKATGDSNMRMNSVSEAISGPRVFLSTEEPKDPAELSTVKRHPVEEMNYTETEIMSCLQRNGRLAAFTNKLRIHFSYGPLDMISFNYTSVCTVTVTTTPGRKLRFVPRRVTGGFCVYEACVKVTDSEDFMSWYPNCDKPYDFRSSGHNLTVEVHLKGTAAKHVSVVDVISVEVGLHLVRLSPTQGYIETPGNSAWQKYWKLMDSWYRLFPPLDHVTLLSWPRVSIESMDDAACIDMAWVFLGADRVLEIGVCGTAPPEARVRNTREIHVHFWSDSDTEEAGFRLLFSFHPVEHSPHRVKGGLWNCSTPEWPEIQRHFLCNVETECDGGEDEATCYYTPQCGHGYIALYKNSCYKYFVAVEPLSWNEAEFFCLYMGGHLLSLNTPQEWDAVIKFLDSRRYQTPIHVGLKNVKPVLPIYYQHKPQWADLSSAFYLQAAGASSGKSCGSYWAYTGTHGYMYMNNECNDKWKADFLCEWAPLAGKRDRVKQRSQRLRPTDIEFKIPPKVLTAVPHVECPSGHLTHVILACDERSSCWLSRRDYDDERTGIPPRASCPAPMTSLPPMFTCRSGSQRVSYSMVCDHRQQCSDGTDENFCVFPPCSGSTPLECATSKQCIAQDMYCDNTEQCLDRSDESDCLSSAEFVSPTLPPAIVHFDALDVWFDPEPYFTQNHRGENLPASPPCPHTHFLCTESGYCLPVFLRCNGVTDCPGQDEVDCGVNEFTCQGFYRCRDSPVCLHVSTLCDGVAHCPEQDDEVYCHFLPCPSNCTCHGLAFSCSGFFRAEAHRELRYLNAEGSDVSVSRLLQNTMLVYLNLASCKLQTLEDFAFPNLLTLDVDSNFITTFASQHLRKMPNLRLLILSGNPLIVFSADRTFSFDHLESVDLSRAALKQVNLSHFASFPNLLNLNISNSAVTQLSRRDNRSVKRVRVIDMRRCRIPELQYDVMSDLDDLETVYAENYKWCCPAILPPMFNRKNCHAPLNPVASCTNLLSSVAHRTVLALCCSFALLGNVIKIAVSVSALRSGSYAPVDVFVTHLAVGDVVMGACVAVVAVADRFYWGRYVTEDSGWRHSVTCKAVGFFYMLSSQLCVSMVFLITFNDLVSMFARTRALMLKPMSAHVLSAVTWMGWLILAALPLAPSFRHWELFGQTSACFSLLVTNDNFTHSDKASFVVAVVVLSLFLVMLTALSQIWLSSKAQRTGDYSIIKTYSLKTSVAKSRGRGAIHASTFSQCVLNVVCWIPMCALAALAWRGGSPLPDELHVHVGMIAVPLTSAIRPFLHYMAVREERKRRNTAEKLMMIITAKRRQKNRKQN